MSSLMEALLESSNIGNSNNKEWNSRTPESISNSILDAIANKKAIVGAASGNKPREVLLARHLERSPEFRDALEIVATQILQIFPNDLEIELEIEETKN